VVNGLKYKAGITETLHALPSALLEFFWFYKYITEVTENQDGNDE